MRSDSDKDNTKVYRGVVTKQTKTSYSQQNFKSMFIFFESMKDVESYKQKMPKTCFCGFELYRQSEGVAVATPFIILLFCR